MSRTPLPLHAQDISAFARSLGGQLARHEGAPSHLELLNMLARSTGFRNFQHLRAAGLAQPGGALAQAVPSGDSPSADVPSDDSPSGDAPSSAATETAAAETAAPAQAPAANANRLRRLARLFDAEGRLVRWPSRRGLEQDCLWVVWSRIEPRRVYAEAELKQALNALHTFGDDALLRRGLCDLGLMARTPDGREYRRLEAKPTLSALTLLELLRQRRG